MVLFLLAFLLESKWQLFFKRDTTVLFYFQLDEEGIGRVTVSDNALDELDTIMIGGILNSQFDSIQDMDDYKSYLNFTGCMSGGSREQLLYYN